MSVISDLNDRLENVLTVDATPSTPRTPVEDDLLELFDMTRSPASKISGSRPFVTPTSKFEQSESKFDPTSGMKCPNGKINDQDGDDVDDDFKEQRKNSGFKKRPKTKAKSATAINYNIINSNDVKICPKTSFICNINQHMTVPDNLSQKSKIVKPMPNSIKDFSKSEKKISLNDMLVIKQHMGSGWRDVARKLNYNEGQIEQFQENFSSKGLDEVIYQFLLDWKRANSIDAKLGILVKAMWECHQYQCVKELLKSRKESS